MHGQASGGPRQRTFLYAMACVGRLSFGSLKTNVLDDCVMAMQLLVPVLRAKPTLSAPGAPPSASEEGQTPAKRLAAGRRHRRNGCYWWVRRDNLLSPAEVPAKPGVREHIGCRLATRCRPVLLCARTAAAPRAYAKGACSHALYDQCNQCKPINQLQKLGDAHIRACYTQQLCTRTEPGTPGAP